MVAGVAPFPYVVSGVGWIGRDRCGTIYPLLGGVTGVVALVD